MITNWKVLVETVNINGGYALVESITDLHDEKSARLSYHGKISQYGGNPKVAFVRVSLIAPNGYTQMLEEIDNRVVEEPTEEVAE